MTCAQPDGYFAIPPTGKGSAVLVLHAWWGLNGTMRAFCTRLAESGFVAFAADLYHGKVSESDERTYGEAVAAALGAEPATVFKTLVAQLTGGELVVAVVPLTGTLDLRRLAVLAQAKSAAMAEPSLAEKATGYVTGGISPFGSGRGFARSWTPPLSVTRRCTSAQGGAVCRSRSHPHDLVLATGATVAELGR